MMAQVLGGKESTVAVVIFVLKLIVVGIKTLCHICQHQQFVAVVRSKLVCKVHRCAQRVLVLNGFMLDVGVHRFRSVRPIHQGVAVHMLIFVPV